MAHAASSARSLRRTLQSSLLAGTLVIFVLTLAAPASARAEGVLPALGNLLARATSVPVRVVEAAHEGEAASESTSDESPSPGAPVTASPVSSVVQQAKELVVHTVSSSTTPVLSTVKRAIPGTLAAGAGKVVQEVSKVSSTPVPASGPSTTERSNAGVGSSIATSSAKRAPARGTATPPQPAPGARAHTPPANVAVLPGSSPHETSPPRLLESSARHAAGARPNHLLVEDGAIGDVPPASPTPGGGSTSAAGAVGTTAPPLLAITFTVLLAMLAASRRLRLSGHPRLTPPFALILTRPG